MHRSFTTLLLWAVVGCGAESDPVAPASSALPAALTIVSTAGAPAAVQDVLDRLIPSLAPGEAATALDESFRRLAASWAAGSDRDHEAALASALTDLDRYARGAGDDPDVDAVRLALHDAQEGR